MEKYRARLPAQVPASSVSKVSRWQRKTGAEGRSVRPRRRETSRRRSRRQPCAQKEVKKTVQSTRNVWRQKAVVDETEHLRGTRLATMDAPTCRFYVISITAVVVIAKKMISIRQLTMALTVSSGMSRRTRSGEGASVPEADRPFW